MKKTVHPGRLQKLFAALAAEGIDALLISSWPNVTYMTGFQSTESWAVISAKGLFFITDSRYIEQAKTEATGFEMILRDGRAVTEIVADLAKRHRWKTVGFEAAIVTHAFYLSLAKRLGSLKPKATVGLIEKLREIKDSSEISLIRRSADIAVKGFHYIKDIARPGMKERDLQARLEHYTKTLGSDKPAFDIIIAAGKRSSMPHCQTNDTLTQNNEILLVDMGVVYRGYHSDLTRPIFLGRISPLHKKIFDIVWKAQRAGIAKAGPGVHASAVDAACRDYIRKRGYDKQFGHGTGHGVGLEIHEGPTVSARSQTVLKPGMVITVEPGIYLANKFGVRIEDMVLITPNGHEVLTRDLDQPV